MIQCITYMGWLRLVGSIKLYVSFAKEAYKRDPILWDTHNDTFITHTHSVDLICVTLAYTCVLVCMLVCVHV